jgi:group II intron reverse transcriptase/maturase
MQETPSSQSISPRLQRIAKLAKQAPEAALTTLAHHIDIDWMREAHRRVRKGGATGVDGQTAEQYAVQLESNLRMLLDRAKSGTYRAPPVRRVSIPKEGDDGLRPIGIPTFEDKILQRAVAMVLEAVYEQDFLDCSFGFRPRRSAHQALNVLRNELMAVEGGWVLEADIRKFFDTIDHAHLRDMLTRRVRDGVILRLIGKWLNAGVLTDGQLHRPEAGSPQGGVISPLLANIYLHEVLDKWFEREVKPRLRSRGTLIRFADDFVMVFALQEDARRVLDVLAKRLCKYGLTLHPDKTRLVHFRRPRKVQTRRGSGGDAQGPESFDFLGFTHHWARSRNGNWVVKLRTSRARINRTLRRTNDWCRRHRHQPVVWQRDRLRAALLGHYAYFAITGNMRCVEQVRRGVVGLWRKWLNRRSQRRCMPWPRMYRLLERHALPWPSLMHRFTATPTT